MKFLLDFFPIALFFIVYKMMGLYPAIYAMIGATMVQMLVARLQTGKFEKMHLITLGLLVVFGGITLIVRDPAFLMWKVSVLYVVFALVLVASLWIGEKTLMQRIAGKELDLPQKIWRRITWFWGLGFIGIAIVNSYYVRLALTAREKLFAATVLDKKIELAELDCITTTAVQLCQNAQQTESSWVNFKLFGTMGLTFILILLTIVKSDRSQNMLKERNSAMKKTPLYQAHLDANGKMVDFCTWEMPLNYGSQLKEHNQVRNNVGMFDVSHMSVVDLKGKEAKKFLQILIANDVNKLKMTGKALYSCMLNEVGGVVDDLIVYYHDDTNYRIVINACTMQKDIEWINVQSKDFDVFVGNSTPWLTERHGYDPT